MREVGATLKVTLTANPDRDLRFRQFVDHCLAAGAGTPAELQSCLRVDYPRASVTNGIIDRGFERWYAYRDGYWIRPAEGVEEAPSA